MNINIQNTNTETILLKDLVQQKRIEMKRGNVISKTTGQYPVYSSSVQNNGLMCYSDDYMFDEELISWSIDGGGDFFYRPKHKYSLTNVSGYIRVLDKNINCKYLYCVLDLLHSKEHFDYTTKAHPSVICKMYKVPLPNIEVQKKIATILFTMEDLINEEQSTITKLKETKRSLLELLFPSNNSSFPQLRFKNFTSPWEQCKLGDVVQITMGQSPDGNTYSDEPSDYILVQGNADLQNGWVFPRVWTTQITKKANAGDLIMSVRAPAGTVGKTAYNIVIGRGIAAIKGNEFIYQTLVKMDINNFWKSFSCGSTFESLNSNDIKNAKIKIPIVFEQSKIGNLFSNLDHLITLHQRKLKKYKEIKSALLDKLLV